MSFSNPNLDLAESDNDLSEETKNLFLGDKGELCFESRKVLVQLLSGPFVDARRHSKNWQVLARNEALIRSRLAELFLELIMDHDLQIAFTRQIDVGDLQIPTLLRSAQLTFIDSVLVLYLRQQLSQADAQNIRATISPEEIEEYMALYERANNTDKAGFVKRVRASIEKMKKYNILQRIRSHEARFEISPTLKLLFSAEEIQTLTRLYQKEICIEAEQNETESVDSDITYPQENL